MFYQYNADASHASRALSARFGVVVTILLPGSISGRIQSFPAKKTHLIAFDVHDSYTGPCVPHALRVRQKKRERNVLNKASYSQMCLADSVQFGQQTTMSHCTFKLPSGNVLSAQKHPSTETTSSRASGAWSSVLVQSFGCGKYSTVVA